MYGVAPTYEHYSKIVVTVIVLLDPFPFPWLVTFQEFTWLHCYHSRYRYCYRYPILKTFILLNNSPDTTKELLILMLQII